MSTLHAKVSAKASSRPRISILTPTWNRASYLERSWQGLNRQTYTNFEWLVADDGSVDGTEDIVKALAARSNFPVIYIKASVHIGKPRMDNELLNHSTGEFLIWNDSDDWYLPHALEHFIEQWDKIPAENQPEYIGITALCSDAGGRLQSSAVPFNHSVVTTWDDLRFTHDVAGDMCLMVQKSLLGDSRFVEVDFMITESSYWQPFSNLKTVFSPVVLKVMDRTTANRISFSQKMEYCRGKAYGLAMAESAVPANRRGVLRGIWLSITFWRYSYLGEIPWRSASALWRGGIPRVLHLASAPLGWALAWKDIIQRKVVRTHREFEAVKDVVTISRKDLN